MKRESSLLYTLKNLAILIAILWLIHLIGYILPIRNLGIKPREAAGLIGILTAPLIHASVMHLVTNSISLLAVGLLMAAVGGKRYVLITIGVALIGGLGTWLIGRGGVIHVGASGVIFGQLGYLFTLGLFTRRMRHIIVAFVAIFLYGGAITGLLPGDSFVSWESHLSGFVAGIVIARADSRKGGQ